jgi:hypothetical protein
MVICGVDSVKMMILSSISNGLKSILVVLIGLGIRPKYFGFEAKENGNPYQRQ